jgi:hypothetical protein
LGKYLKKIHFLNVLEHSFFPKIKDVFVNMSGLNIVTQITDGVNLRELNKVSQIDGEKRKFFYK